MTSPRGVHIHQKVLLIATDCNGEPDMFPALELIEYSYRVPAGEDIKMVGTETLLRALRELVADLEAKHARFKAQEN